jgi:hypothetical protein
MLVSSRPASGDASSVVQFVFLLRLLACTAFEFMPLCCVAIGEQCAEAALGGDATDAIDHKRCSTP